MSAVNGTLLAQAGTAHAEGRLADAERLVRQVLSSDPSNAQANLLAGVLAAKGGRTEAAVKFLAAALEREQDLFEALFWMSIVRRRSRELPAAVEFAERAVQARPRDAHGLNNLGLCYLDSLRLEEAADAFRRAIAINANMASIHHNLGTALHLLGRDVEAAKAFDLALIWSPDSAESYLSLGQVMISQTNPEAAAECGRRALHLNPKSAAAHLLLASALVEESKTAEAEVHLRKAVQLDPRDAKARGLLGMRYQSLGRFEEANAELAKSLELEPRQGFAYFAYAHNNKVGEKDRPLVDKMEGLAASGGLAPRETDFLHYALGRSYESLGEYEKAIRHFDEANRLARKLKFGDERFDRAAYASEFDWLVETFDKEYLRRLAGTGIRSDLPIVIVGMMRSGTTLCEQILSSHPEVGAAGEQRFWPLSRREMFGEDRRLFDSTSLPKLANRYCELLKGISPEGRHVTDKMPANYELLGPIHAALPNARIIHMRRNPVDTCISIYTTPNRVPVPFAYDRDNIVFAYRQYERLMEDWRSVLPADRFMEVRYEELVADREAQTRRMLEFLGLPWDDAVLHHEENVRSVITPSLWQVRQPIYSSSVERWRRYEPWLGAFVQLLKS